MGEDRWELREETPGGYVWQRITQGTWDEMVALGKLTEPQRPRNRIMLRRVKEEGKEQDV